MIISSIYAIAAVLSLLLLTAYFFMIKKKEAWFFVLFTAILVVNAGYFALSISDTLDAALWANRLSYAGSVFLPLSMLMIILQALQIRYQKWLPYLLIAVSIAVFLVAASPGYLDIYYADVTLAKSDGATMLVKEYGPWHMLYYVYLAVYFLTMIVCIRCGSKKRNLEQNLHSTILAAAVFVNIGVWLMEQFANINFEFLSISYVMTGLFIIFLKMLQVEMLKVQDDKIRFQKLAQQHELENGTLHLDAGKRELFAEGLAALTQTERRIFDLYLEGRTTKEVLAALDIKENTLKYHNKNIYGKLGVSSRKELLAVAKAVEL